MAKLDITKTNLAVERLLEATENPRHRFLLQAYHRHRYLEIAGRYKEIFVPEMTVERPVYHFHALGLRTTLEGQDAVARLYRLWARTGQCIMAVEHEQVAVADGFIASVSVGSQQVPGAFLRRQGHDVDDPAAMYVYKTVEEMIWPYDARGRLLGEDVWEVDPAKAEIYKLAPEDVLTAAQAAALLGPLTRPLPAFDEAVMGPSRR